MKEFYKTWLEPLGVRRLRTREPHVHLQKMWAGTPVPAPLLEREYFSALLLEGVTITRRDDSRNCALITREASLPIPTLDADESVQLAVTADQWLKESRVTVAVGEQATTHRSLRPGRWLDIRLDGPSDAKALRITTDQPLWTSYPRAVHHRRARTQASQHIILMVLDGMSRRLLETRHPTSPETELTPNLNRLFAGGLNAPLGFAASDWTLPTTASFFTGVVPSRHRMVHPVFPMKYPADRPLLAETLQRAGYHTLALSAGNRLTPAFDAHRGFDRFIYHWAAEGRSTFDYDPAVWVNEIVSHLALHQNDRTFTYAHFPDTHPPWDIPPVTRSFNLGRRGDSTGHDLAALERSSLGRDQGRQLVLLRLHELDRVLGVLVDYVERRIADRAVVVLTADHGTPWHDFPTTNPPDRPSLNEFRIGTSLRLRAPGIAEETRAAPVCPNLDLMPTLLSLAGLAIPADLDGVNLLGPSPGDRRIVSESMYRNVYEIAVSDRDFQWIEKFPLDERTTRITGPAFYRGLHRTNAGEYSAAAAATDPERERLVREHLRRVGIGAE